MTLGVEIKPNRGQLQFWFTSLHKSPQVIKDKVVLSWNELCLEFRSLMQDRHLEGGTTEDRLSRRSSNLYNSLRHEVVINDLNINASVWFLSGVQDYAPTHEYGDTSRNIPARMNMRNEWKNFYTRFKAGAVNAMKETPL